MSGHQYQNVPDPLETPAIVKRSQYEALQQAVLELQKNAITAIRVNMAAANCLVVEGEAFLDQQGSNNAGTAGFTGELALVMTVSWSDPILSFRPIFLRFSNGLLQSATVGSDVTVDAAEAC